MNDFTSDIDYIFSPQTPTPLDRESLLKKTGKTGVLFGGSQRSADVDGVGNDVGGIRLGFAAWVTVTVRGAFADVPVIAGKFTFGTLVV